MSIYLIVINNIFRLKTIDRLSLLGDLRPSIKHTWQLAVGILSTIGSLGTATVLSPLPSSDPHSPDDHYTLARGRQRRQFVL